MRNQWLSEKPGITIGTSVASGSASESHSRIAPSNSVSSGDSFPLVVSVNSISTCSGSSARTGAIRSRTAASSRPGGTRVSITAWATDGITLSRAEALALVGTRVTRSIGSAR